MLTLPVGTSSAVAHASNSERHKFISALNV
jgi:hypothetical protein